MSIVPVRPLGAACILFGLSGIAAADTVSIVASADTTLSQRMPNNNLGDHSQVLAGPDGAGQLRRGLLLFDVLGSIPPGSIIDSATLSLTVNSSNVNTGDYHLHRMLVDWTEGIGQTSQGSPALPGETTWNNRHHPATAWGAAGGLAGTDYIAMASATTTVSSAGAYSWTGLAADVQMMLDSPLQNHGWMLVSNQETTVNTARQFESRQSPTEAFPTLAVSYHQIPEPAGGMLAGWMLAVVALKLRAITRAPSP